jgi:Subtilase family
MQACFSDSDQSGVSLCPNGQQTQTGAGAANNDIPACANGNVSLCSHGTHVAGIAAGINTVVGALPANGVAKSAKIVPVQVFTGYNSVAGCKPNQPPCNGFQGSDLQQALEWIYMNALNPATGVRLAAVNLSLGYNEKQYASACDADFDTLKAYVDLLRGAGVVTVAAAGNDGIKNLIDSPACISTAVAVGSTDKQDRISIFSSMSPQVSLVAPGGLGPQGTLCMPGANNPNIRSSISGLTAAQNGLYNCYYGTSMAAPHVAGAFAAIRTVCPDAAIDRIVAALQTTGLTVPYEVWSGPQTAKRISVDLARQALGCASHDFNGDGKSDLLWRDYNGNLSVWLMNGARATSQAGIGSATSTWAIVGQRDFDGDGKYDLLWRDTSGNNSIWFMNGTQVKSRVGVSMLPTTWSAVGTGDFDASGFGGILWRDTAGNTMIWLMDGAQVYSSGSLGNVPPTWSVAGTGDFDGDGKCDILWRYVRPQLDLVHGRHDGRLRRRAQQRAAQFCGYRHRRFQWRRPD